MRVAKEVLRVNHGQALGIGEPDAAVRRLGGYRLPFGMAGEFHRFQPVEHLAVDAVRFAVREVIQALAAGPHDAGDGIHPEIALVIGDDLINIVIAKALLGGDVLKLVILDARDAAGQTRPNRAIHVFENARDIIVGQALRGGPLPHNSVC